MGGSGGSSGAVSHSAYLETVHNDWLDDTGVDTITSSMTAIMNAAQGSSPWTAQVPYDPDTDITAYEAAIAAFAAILAGITDTTDWAALHTQAGTSIDGLEDAEITADVTAFGNELDDQITTITLPRFQRGMQDINAVVSSAFVLGQSNIEAFRDRDVAKHSSGLRVAAITQRSQLYLEASKQMLQLMLQRISFEDSYMKTVIEGKRIKIVAKKEENDVGMQIDEKDALWDLEIFNYGSNLLAGISGGTTAPLRPSLAQSAIGGALSGAAAGAMIAGASEGAIAGPVGMIAGGVLGAASAFL